MIQTFSEEEQDKLRSLMQHPGWEVYERIVNDRLADAEQRILQGKLRDHGEYIAQTAERQGLQYALERPAQIVRQRPEGIRGQ